MFLETQSDNSSVSFKKDTQVRQGRAIQANNPKKILGFEWVATCLMPLATASEEGRIEDTGKSHILPSSQNLSLPTGQKNVGEEWLRNGYHWQEGLTQFSAAV